MIKGDPREERLRGNQGDRSVKKDKRRKCLEQSEQSTVPSVAETGPEEDCPLQMANEMNKTEYVVGLGQKGKKQDAERGEEAGGLLVSDTNSCQTLT